MPLTGIEVRHFIANFRRAPTPKRRLCAKIRLPFDANAHLTPCRALLRCSAQAAQFHAHQPKDPCVVDRNQRLNVSAGIASVGVAFVLVALKVWALAATGALSVAASLADSAVDLLASTAGLIGIVYAAKPPDDDHSFGHSSAEDLGCARPGARGRRLRRDDRLERGAPPRRPAGPARRNDRPHDDGGLDRHHLRARALAGPCRPPHRLAHRRRRPAALRGRPHAHGRRDGGPGRIEALRDRLGGPGRRPGRLRRPGAGRAPDRHRRLERADGPGGRSGAR